MDVCSSGERWEGSSVAGIAYGYGCFYDDDNRPLYKGFTWNGKKVLFGIEYFNNGIPSYIGCFYNGNYHGYGTSYTRKEEILYQGFWFLNNNDVSNKEFYISSHPDKTTLFHYHIETMVVDSDYSPTMETLCILSNNHLKSITIKNNSFTNTFFIIIKNCMELETIDIGSNCFSPLNNQKASNPKGSLLIQNCSNLQSITINHSKIY